MQSLSGLGACSSACHALQGRPLQFAGDVVVAIHVVILGTASHVTPLVVHVGLVFHVADDVRADLRNNGWGEVGDDKLWRVRLSLRIRLLLLAFFGEHVVELSRSCAQIVAKALPLLRDRLALLLEEMQCLSLGVYTSRVRR